MSSNLPGPIRPVPKGPLVGEFHDSDELEDQGFELRQFLKIVLKYRLLLSTIVGLSVAAALVYAFTATPLYTARTTLRVSTFEPNIPTLANGQVNQPGVNEVNLVTTKVNELKSLVVADRVLAEPEIREALFPADGSSGGFFSVLFGGGTGKVVETTAGEHFTSPLSQLRSYLDMVAASPLRNTSLVNLEVTSKSPVLSARLANLHARVYTIWVRENRIERQSRGLEFLQEQANELKAKIVSLEKEMTEYAEEHSIVALNDDENITVQRMAQLNNLLTGAVENRLEAENLFKEAEKNVNSENAGFDDPSVQQSRIRLADLRAEYSRLGEKFTDDYPQMRQLSAQIKELEEAIQGGRRQVLAGLQAKALAARQKEAMLREELEKQKSATFELSKSQVQYNVLKRELDSSRELYNLMLRQMKEMGVAVQNNATEVAILDNAAIPDSPSFPRKRLIVVLGLVLGVGLGLGLAFILHLLDNTVRTLDDVVRTVSVPNLGVVPSFALENDRYVSQRYLSQGGSSPAEHTPQSDVLPPEPAPSALLPIVFLEGPRSLAAESYRTIRTALLLSQANQPPKRILITSALPGEGKSTSTSNLTATLASSGRKVLLIDADLRRPVLWSYFHVERDQPGLVDVLTGQKAPHEVIRETGVENISILPAGVSPPNPAELLGSQAMARLLDDLGDRYDHILIDSPPIIPVTDSVVLSRYVDGVVLVVKSGGTPRSVLREAMGRLRSVGAHVLGTVLNSADPRKDGHYLYNKYYRTYYQEDYQSRASAG